MAHVTWVDSWGGHLGLGGRDWWLDVVFVEMGKNKERKYG
jgi:hypothetical protein